VLGVDPKVVLAFFRTLFECKPCGLMVTAEALRGSMQPLIERRFSY
jgi:hypothetical protein